MFCKNTTKSQNIKIQSLFFAPYAHISCKNETFNLIYFKIWKYFTTFASFLNMQTQHNQLLQI